MSISGLEYTWEFAKYVEGARDMLLALKDMNPKDYSGYKKLDNGKIVSARDGHIYIAAIYKMLLADRMNIYRYAKGFSSSGISGFECRFRNHKRDAKGKLISVEAYFVEK